MHPFISYYAGTFISLLTLFANEQNVNYLDDTQEKKRLSSRKILMDDLDNIAKNQKEIYVPLDLRTGSMKVLDPVLETLKENQLRLKKLLDETSHLLTPSNLSDRPLIDEDEVKLRSEIVKAEKELQKREQDKHFLFFHDANKPVTICPSHIKYVPTKYRELLNPSVFNAHLFCLQDSYEERAAKYYKLGLNITNSDMLPDSIFKREDLDTDRNKQMLLYKTYLTAQVYYHYELINIEGHSVEDCLRKAQLASNAVQCAKWAYCNALGNDRKLLSLVVQNDYKSIGDHVDFYIQKGGDPHKLDNVLYSEAREFLNNLRFKTHKK